MKKVQNYLKSVVTEFKKVTWPTSEELKNSTYLVILFSLLSAFIIFVSDSVLIRLVGAISKLVA